MKPEKSKWKAGHILTATATATYKGDEYIIAASSAAALLRVCARHGMHANKRHFKRVVLRKAHVKKGGKPCAR